MKIKLNTSKENFYKNLIPWFYILISCIYLIGLPTIYRVYFSFFIVIISIPVIANMLKRNPLLLVFFLLFIVSAISTNLHNYNHSMEKSYFWSSLMYINMAILLLRYGPNFKYSKFLFYIVSLFFVCNMIIGVKSDTVLQHISRNYISVLMLVNMNLYYIGAKGEKKDLGLLPAILFFIISVWSVGRGPIITSGFFLTCILLIKIFREENKVYKKSLIISLIILIIILSIFVVDFDFILNYFVQFKIKGAVDASRISIYKEYFSASVNSISNFLLGVSIESLYSGQVYSGNLHNSFLQMHAYFGLTFSAVVLVLLFKSIIFFVKRKDFVMVALILTLLIRASTDMLFFTGYPEVFLYYYCLYPYIRNGNVELETA